MCVCERVSVDVCRMCVCVCVRARVCVLVCVRESFRKREGEKKSEKRARIL